MAHFNTAIYQKLPFKAKNFQPIAPISDELFAADFSALPNIISTEISQRLTAKISSMSKKERKNLITSLAMIEGWSNDSGVHLRCAIRHIFNGRPHKLAEQITKNDPIRLLEVVRLMEEPFYHEAVRKLWQYRGS